MKSPVRNPWSQMQILKRFMCSTFLFSSLFLHMWSQNVIFDLRQHVVQRILKKWVQVRQKKFLTYKRIYSRWTVSESCSQEWEKTNCIKLTQEPGNTCTEKHSGTPAVTDWPPQSPDLNIIEAMWDDPDRESQDPKRSLNVQEACRTIFGGYLEKWEESWKVKTATTNIPAGSNLYKVSLSYKLF